MDEKNLRDYMTLQASLRNPVFHLPVDLGIKKFKHLLDTLNLTRTQRSYAIRQYKEKGWIEYNEIVKHKGTFPAHKNVVNNTGEASGKREEQKADLSVAGEQGVLRPTTEQVSPDKSTDKEI